MLLIILSGIVSLLNRQSAATYQRELSLVSGSVLDVKSDGADSLIVLSDLLPTSARHGIITRINVRDQSEQQLATFEAAPYNLFVTDSTIYASAMDGLVRGFKKNSGSQVGRWQASYAWHTYFFQDPVRKEIYTASGNGKLTVLSDAGRVLRSSKIQSFNGIAFLFSRGQYVIGEKGSLGLFSLSTLGMKRVINSIAESDFADNLLLSPDGNHLAVCITSTTGKNGSGTVFTKEIRLYDTRTWSIVARKPPLGDEQVPIHLAYSSDSSQLGIIGGGMLSFIQVSNGNTLKVIPVSVSRPFTHIVSLPDRSWIVLACGEFNGKYSTTFSRYKME